MKSSVYVPQGTKVILAFQDPEGKTIVYTGFLNVPAELSYSQEFAEIYTNPSTSRVFPVSMPVLAADLDIALLIQDDKIRRWEDIRPPVAEIHNTKAIEE